MTDHRNFDNPDQLVVESLVPGQKPDKLPSSASRGTQSVWGPRGIILFQMANPSFNKSVLYAGSRKKNTAHGLGGETRAQVMVRLAD